MLERCASHFREKMDLRPAFPPCPHPRPIPLGTLFPHSSSPPLSYRSSLEGWHFQLNKTRDHHYGNSRPCSPCETSWEVGGGWWWQESAGGCLPPQCLQYLESSGALGQQQALRKQLGEGVESASCSPACALLLFLSIPTTNKYFKKRKRKKKEEMPVSNSRLVTEVDLLHF